ncbi:MAG TPA: hypothetical protein P5337_00720 [Aestuariivirga sp.]|nr:hypothetical protein [Alphaproteobacteria bacterium]HRX34892.1 hypothetical protein [Aestuariivirga sp.]
MQARLFMMTLGPGMRDVATAIANEAYQTSKGMPGFVSATYMIFDEAGGEYGSLTVWKTEADANAAAEKLTPWVMQKIGDKFKSPPVIRLAEIHEPA